MRSSNGWTLRFVLALPLTGACGCQTPGEYVSEEASQVCPGCKTETRTHLFKGLTYKKHVCPHCHSLGVPTDYGEDTVHYCSRCEAIVEPCPQCEKQ